MSNLMRCEDITGMTHAWIRGSHRPIRTLCGLPAEGMIVVDNEVTCQRCKVKIPEGLLSGAEAIELV